MGYVGGGLLTLLSLAFVSVGFSSWVVEGEGADIDPLNVDIADVGYGQTISLSSINFRIVSNSPTSPDTFTVNDVVYFNGVPSFGISANISFPLITSLDYIEGLYLKCVPYYRRSGSAQDNPLPLSSLRVSLNRNEFYFIDLTKSGNAFYVPVKCRTTDNLYSLTSMDGQASEVSISGATMDVRVNFSGPLNTSSMSVDSYKSNVSSYRFVFSMCAGVGQ